MTRVLIGLASASLLLAACATSMVSPASGPSGSAPAGSPASAAAVRPTIVAAFYPLEYAARAIGGDAVDVVGLTPPGGEPHDLELSAAQVAQIASADLVLYVKGYQPAVDEAVAQQAADHSLDVSAGLTLLPADHADGHEEEHAGEEGATDPHVWLNPLNMAGIGTAITERLSSSAPDGSAAFAANNERLGAEMASLNEQFTAGLASCRSRIMVVSHEAFAYLGSAYGFTQVGISGLSPDAEPSPARMRDVADLVTREGVTTIYYETLVDPKVAKTLADETGATSAVLDPIEGLVAGSAESYPTIMASNLATLRTGQGCT
jgi:zinc transport system substrate-binding protein